MSKLYFLSAVAPRRIMAFTAVLVVSLHMATAQATVVGTGVDVFQPDRFRIDFSALEVGTADPSYRAPVGPSKDATVSFGSYFRGQSIGTYASCGAIGCLNGSPGAGLVLDNSADPTFVTSDVNAPGNAVLSGNPQFAGPISILFGEDQAGVGVSLGYALAAGAERVTAFDRNGNILESIINDATGYSYLTLASEEADREIAGVQITRTGDVDGGFALSDVLFGGPDQVSITGSGAGPGEPGHPVSAPENLSLFAFALGLVVLLLGVRNKGPDRGRHSCFRLFQSRDDAP